MSQLNTANIFLTIGGAKIEGFGKDAFEFATDDEDFISEKGLDSVAWVQTDDRSKELVLTINLKATSPSVKVLDEMAKAKTPVDLSFAWEDIGVEIVTLSALVIAPQTLKIGENNPDQVFTVRMIDFAKRVGV